MDLATTTKQKIPAADSNVTVCLSNGIAYRQLSFHAIQVQGVLTNLLRTSRSPENTSLIRISTSSTSSLKTWILGLKDCPKPEGFLKNPWQSHRMEHTLMVWNTDYVNDKPMLYWLSNRYWLLIAIHQSIIVLSSKDPGYWPAVRSSFNSR